MKTEPLKKTQAKLRSKAAWSPTLKQEEAMTRPEYEIAYGGARGGGKTDSGINWMAYDHANPRFRGLVIRKNATDLTDWVSRARRMYAPMKCVQTSQPPKFVFPSGAEILTGHLKDDKAYEKYQGHEYHRMLIEELTQIPSEENYLKLVSSCRSTVPDLKAQVFTTFNPGGPGHTWVKKRFRLEGVPRARIITRDERTGRMRVFVPATVDDNPFILKYDPDYVHFLDGLPDGLREQWRHGSWDDPLIKGAYFTKELKQARVEGKIGKVPHIAQRPVYTFWDIGADMTCILFVQIDGKAFNVINYYQNESFGLPHYLAKLNQLRDELGYHYATHHFPHDIEHKEWGSGRTRIEILEELDINFEVVPRVQHKDDSIEAARILFPRVYFDAVNCAPLIDGLQNYRQKWDDEKQAFVGHPIHDWASHPSDAFQQLAMANLEALRPDIKDRPSEFAKEDLADDYEVDQKPFSAEFSGSRLSGGGGRFHYDD